MDGNSEFFRKSVNEFKVADSLLSRRLKQHENEAITRQAHTMEGVSATEHLIATYQQAIETMCSASEQNLDFKITPEVDLDIAALKKLSADVKWDKDELDRIYAQIAILEQNLRAILVQEQSDQRRRNYIRAALAACALGVLITLHFWLLNTTTLTFRLSLDGRSFSSEIAPQITVDGYAFIPGSRIKLGRHQLTAIFPGGEPLEKRIWTFYGSNDLGILPLETSKGSLLVVVKPLPATVLVKQGQKIISQGEAPFKVQNVPVGDYTISIHRGDYEQSSPITIDRQQLIQTNIALKLGGARLLSDPPDAQFELSDGKRRWRGDLPITIDEVPAGYYSLAVKRNGWELMASILIRQDNITTNEMEFPYGSIDVVSDPSGMVVSTNGAKIGTTPLSLKELKPGQYTLSASDGENDVLTNISVAPRESVKQAFTFRYATVQLSSIPEGASIIRKGSPIGKTPKTMERLIAGETTMELQLSGYVSTNVAVHAIEGVTTDVSITLVSEKYMSALSDARSAAGSSPPDYHRALESLNQALQISPDDAEAVQLRDDYEFKIRMADASNLLRNNDLEKAREKINAILAIKPTDSEALGLRQKLSAAITIRAEQLSDERTKSAAHEFDQILDNVSAHCHTPTVVATQLKTWMGYTTLSRARDVLLHTVARSGQWKVKSEAHPTPDVIVVFFTPPGVLLWDKTMEDNQLNFIVQICSLPNDSLDIRAKMITGIMADANPVGYEKRRTQKQEARFEIFETEYDKEMKSLLIKSSKPTSDTFSRAELEAIAVLDPEAIMQNCSNGANKSDENFSKLNTADAARSNPAAVPVAAATDVIVKGIEVLELPFRKKHAKFNHERFLSNYESRLYRYYGIIANADVNNKTITFESKGVAKESYVVLAQLREQPTATAFPVKPGATVWISGQLVALEEASAPSSVANRLVLENGTIYSPDILPTSR